MLFGPLYVCLECGKFGGLGLSFSQSMAKAAKGEQIEKGKPYIPECENGHGPMYEVQEKDRLHVVSKVMEMKEGKHE